MPPANLQFGGVEEEQPQQLTSLEDFNNNFYQKPMDAQMPTPNGIACPSCGEEMLDLYPHITLNSTPPQKNIACTSCGYQGYRYA